MNFLNDFTSCDNIKLTERIETYLNNYTNYENSQNNLINSKKFEFNFFKLTKILLIDESLIKNELDLKSVLNYCLNKSIQQYNLFQAQNQPDEHIDGYNSFDENDELNIIELMNNYKLNLLNLMHCFSSLFKSLNRFEPKKKTLTFYDYMSAYVSIYLDISIELELKIQNSSLINIKCDRLNPQDLCLNTFYLLDSSVYYICNSLLQLKSFEYSNLNYLLPILHKIIDLKTIYIKKETKIKPKICRSLYTKYLLIYCMLRNLSTDIDKIKFFKEFIKLYKIPFQFKKFINKLLTCYVHSSETNKLSSQINQYNSDKKLRKFFINDLNEVYVKLFVTALHNRALNIKNNDSISPILDSSDIKLNQVESIQDEHPIEINTNIDIQNEIEQEEVEENEYELEFTSDGSELTQYDVNSLVDPTEPIHLITPIKSSDKLNMKAQVVLKRIDLKYFTQLTSKSYSTKTPEQLRFENKMLNFSLTKRYEEISKRKSPTKNNISKLNLFRNIYEENNYLDSQSIGDYRNDYNFNNNNGFFEYSKAKFYKLNDLVSIMVTSNEEKTAPINIGLTKDLASIYNDCNKSIINDFKSISTLNKYDDPKEMINDIELTRNEFKKRKQDFLEKNAKTYKTTQMIESSELLIPKSNSSETLLFKKTKKYSNKSKKSKPIQSVSLINYDLRSRLPNAWYNE